MLIEVNYFTTIPMLRAVPFTIRRADSKVKQLTIAGLFAETISRIINNESISNQYLM